MVELVLRSSLVGCDPTRYALDNYIHTSAAPTVLISAYRRDDVQQSLFRRRCRKRTSCESRPIIIRRLSFDTSFSLPSSYRGSCALSLERAITPSFGNIYMLFKSGYRHIHLKDFEYMINHQIRSCLQDRTTILYTRPL